MRSGVAVLALLLMSLALGPASDAVIVHPYMCERWLREDTAGDVDGVEEVKPSGIPPSS